MPYKDKEKRREHYKKNKDEINRKRREYDSSKERKKIKAAQYKKWREKNKAKLHEYNRKYFKERDIKEKSLIFEHYGKKCECCGEDNPKFLTIDHINGGGTKHRKKIGNKINRWLVKNNFPKGFQVLCFNCNWGKHINGGICPHKG